MKSFSNETLNSETLSSRSSVPPTFWILPKMYELFKSCPRNPLETWNKRALSTIYLKNHILVNMLLCSSHSTEEH